MFSFGFSFFLFFFFFLGVGVRVRVRVRAKERQGSESSVGLVAPKRGQTAHKNHVDGSSHMWGGTLLCSCDEPETSSKLQIRSLITELHGSSIVWVQHDMDAPYISNR